jgi:hypothetical protein
MKFNGTALFVALSTTVEPAVTPAVMAGAIKLVPTIALVSSFLQEENKAALIIMIKNKLSFLISVNINNQYFEQDLD